MTQAASSHAINDDQFYEAFEFAFPLYEMAKLRWNALFDPSNSNYTGLNAFWHQEKLATAADRWVTTPNIDTLYSVAWLDLSNAPVRVKLPPADGRYLSIALLDMYTNNFALLTYRDFGVAGGEAILVGPNWTGPLPKNETVIQAPFDDVMLFARVLVYDDVDLPKARAIQHALAVVPMGEAQSKDAPARSKDAGEDFVSLIRDALSRNPPKSYEAGIRRLLEQVGLLPSELVDDVAFNASMRRWNELIPDFLARLRGYLATARKSIDHWIYSPRNLGDFGTSYLLRATVARGGLLALPITEAFYVNTERDFRDEELKGSNIYCLRLPESGIPTDAFWSLTLYENMPSGARFLVDNPLNRYALTNRTTKSETGAGVTIWISHERPPAALEANWLPAPAGPFRLVLRAYYPKPALLDGSFRLAPIRKVANFDARSAE
ncbi:MAG: DUF1254 domain-containing protein [Methylobacteriaceae bacterium]|nr:DUF1254 domain-containing protein [Rhodoblastus sp.]MCC0005830.1 DUF1254 domain-containing protein [Methylobacteriaceae bacterium]